MAKSIMRTFAKSFIIGVVLVGFSSLVNARNQGGGPGLGADPGLPLDGTWQGPYEEFIGGVGSFFQETWTFSGSAELQVTDFAVPGDQFAIYDNGILIGNSSVVPDWSTYESDAFESPPWTADPAVAWLDPHFSHFDESLGNGSHSITIQETVEPSGFSSDGTYSIKGIAIPEPAPMTAVLLGMGTLLALGRLRRMAK
ncbi:MAG: hypothetical protein ABSH14_04665 [Verrucomicrobiia bacterium]